MGSPGAPYHLSKFRILMVHGEVNIYDISQYPLTTSFFFLGFAQNASHFSAKARPISDRIAKLLTPEISSEFPGGIEFLYAEAPLILEHPIGLGINSEDSKDEQETEGQNVLTPDYKEEDLNFLGWWYGRDTVSQYRGVEASLSYLASYIHGRPIHGVLGFSQGGAVAGMISSLLDCGENPEKIAAIRAQGLPVDDFLQLPAQKPLRFCIGIGGYQATVKYYGSLYQWPIQTPSIHALASMDAVVEHYETMKMANSFASYEIVQYHGSHFCPRDRVTIEALACFALRNCCESSTTPMPSKSVNIFDDKVRSDSGLSDSARDYSRQNPVKSKKSAPISIIWRRQRKTCVAWGRCKPAVSLRRHIPAFAPSYLQPRQ